MTDKEAKLGQAPLQNLVWPKRGRMEISVERRVENKSTRTQRRDI